MAVTFHHVHVRCEDLDGAVSYYEKMFDGKVLETVDVRGLKSSVWRLAGNGSSSHQN